MNISWEDAIKYNLGVLINGVVEHFAHQSAFDITAPNYRDANSVNFPNGRAYFELEVNDHDVAYTYHSLCIQPNNFDYALEFLTASKTGGVVYRQNISLLNKNKGNRGDFTRVSAINEYTPEIIENIAKGISINSHKNFWQKSSF